MKFTKYPSIENSYRKEFIQHIVDEGKADGLWVVTEKIHGANFSFWGRRDGVRMGKRTCLLDNNSDFYGAQKIWEEHSDKVMELFLLLKGKGMERLPEWMREKHSLGSVAVFGELFGGNYPHPKVEADPRAKQVQKGIYYHPSNQFLGVDIMIDDKFVGFCEMQIYCEVVGLPYIRALAQGTLKECLEHKNKFSSTIHKYYHLPKIKDNICEGIVIRPNKAKFLYRGSRVMLKSKNAKWSEKAHTKKPMKVASLSEEGEKVKAEIRSMITENRYDSVVSKIGEATASRFGEIMKNFNKDILEEAYKSELAYQFNALDKGEQKLIKKSMNHNIANLVRRKLILGE